MTAAAGTATVGAMQRRTLLLGAAVAAVGIGGWVAWDALTVTDEERIEAFTSTVVGQVTRTRIDRALEWADPSRQPVEVDARGNVRVYDGDGEELARQAHRGLSRYHGDDVRALSEGIEVEGDEAVVSQRLLTDHGMVNVEWLLQRHGQDWLVARVRLR